MTKYRLTYSLLSILMLSSSCSQEEIGGSDNGPEAGRIAFSASLPEVSSRATEVTGSTLENFCVSSFTVTSSSVSPYFLYKTFSKSVTGKFLSYDPECYWPNNDDRLRFVAFAPSCEDMRQAGGFSETDFTIPSLVKGETMASDEYKLSGFRVANDIASQIDFITAIAYGKLLDDEEEGITLDFHHQLSRIELKAWGNSKSYDVEIAGVRLGGVATQGVFSFISGNDTDDASKAGSWEAVAKGSVDYIYRNGDNIVMLDKSEGSPLSSDKAVSIMGSKVGGETGYDNSAMLIPSANPAWSYKDNAANGENNADGMYFSVLLRVTDRTPYDDGKLVYPYTDNPDGMEVIYFAVDKDTNKTIRTRLYKNGDEYFSDATFTSKYDLAANSAEVKAFGWAALPIGDEWKPGYVYTYTLNYSDGVGLRDPRDPKPGDPIISDRVLVNVEIAEWKAGSVTDVSVPRK